MKKKILALALALGALSAMPAVAQNQNPEAPTCTQAECTQKKDCPKQKASKQLKGKKQQAVNPFEGLNLSAEQQAAVKQLNDKRNEARKQFRAQLKSEKGDSVQRPDFKQERRDYLNQLKGILTPEQYIGYLENCVLNQNPMGAPGKGNFRAGNRPGKGDKAQQPRGERPRRDRR